MAVALAAKNWCLERQPLVLASTKVLTASPFLSSRGSTSARRFETSTLLHHETRATRESGMAKRSSLAVVQA